MRCFTRLRFGLLACAACGSVKSGQLPDAPTADSDGGNLDGAANPDGAARGLVRVTVLDPSGTGAPAVGANVVFLDPNGTLVKRAATDTAGKADAEVLAGGSVTSVVLVNATYEIQTVLAVQPGDNLVMGIRNADNTDAGSFTLAFPEVGNALNYIVAHPCGTAVSTIPPMGGTPPSRVTFSLRNGCRRSPMDIVVLASNASGLLGSMNRQVAFVAGGSTSLTGTYDAPRSFTASYTNLPSNVTSLVMTRTVPDELGQGVTQSTPVTNTTASITVTGGSASTAHVSTRVVGPSRANQSIRETLSGTASSYGLDVGARLLPWLGLPDFNVSAARLMIPIDTTGTASIRPDIVRISMGYRRSDPGGGPGTSFAWTVFAPDLADIVLPALPAEVGNVAPLATDSIGFISAIALEADSVTYDALRTDGEATFEAYLGSRPPAARVRFSSPPPVR